MKTILNSLLGKNIISDGQAQMIQTFLDQKPFSIYRELRIILYTGILLLTSGLGVLVYENIDTIGHQVIILLIALVTMACFYHAYTHRAPFTWNKGVTTNKLADYSLLLSCVTFLVLEGYLQYQYQVFGNKYGMALAIPTVIFFFCAYRFDHTGVLTMAITALASWMGLTIAPLSLLSGNDFTHERIILTAIAVGTALLAFSQIAALKNWKKHFLFTYTFLGGNLAAVATLAGLFNHDQWGLYFVIGIALSIYFILLARDLSLGFILLMGVIYGYIILTFTIFTQLPNSFIDVFWIWYMMFSSFGVILFLINFKKILNIRKDEKSI